MQLQVHNTKILEPGSSLKTILAEGRMSFWCAVTVAAIMPVYHWYLPPFMVLWLFVRIIELTSTGFTFSITDKSRRLLFFLFLAFFLWQLAGLLYSDNFDAGRRNIELRLSMLLFPLVLFDPGRKLKAEIHSVLKVFALSNLAFIIICFVFAAFRSLKTGDNGLEFNPHPADAPWLNYFFAMRLAIFQHPSYLAMFTLLSAFISLDFFFGRREAGMSGYTWLVAALILLAAVYFLSSKAEILTAVLALPFYFFRRFRRQKGNRILLASVIAAVVVSVPLFLSNPRVSAYLKNYAQAGKENGGRIDDSRLNIWKTVGGLVKDNFLLGAGTGDIQDELNRKYIESGMNELASNNYNTHNEFIEIQIENGIPGSLLFVSLFIVMLFMAVRDWNLIYVMFIMIVFVSFLFETMLNRLAGVSFFAFFSFLLAGMNGSPGYGE